MHCGPNDRGMSRIRSFEAIAPDFIALTAPKLRVGMLLKRAHFIRIHILKAATDSPGTLLAKALTPF